MNHCSTPERQAAAAAADWAVGSREALWPWANFALLYSQKWYQLWASAAAVTCQSSMCPEMVFCISWTFEVLIVFQTSLTIFLCTHCIWNVMSDHSVWHNQPIMSLLSAFEPIVTLWLNICMSSRPPSLAERFQSLPCNRLISFPLRPHSKSHGLWLFFFFFYSSRVSSYQTISSSLIWWLIFFSIQKKRNEREWRVYRDIVAQDGS